MYRRGLASSATRSWTERSVSIRAATAFRTNGPARLPAPSQAPSRQPARARIRLPSRKHDGRARCPTTTPSSTRRSRCRRAVSPPSGRRTSPSRRSRSPRLPWRLPDERSRTEPTHRFNAESRIKISVRGRERNPTAAVTSGETRPEAWAASATRRPCSSTRRTRTLAREGESAIPVELHAASSNADGLPILFGFGHRARMNNLPRQHS